MDNSKTIDNDKISMDVMDAIYNRHAVRDYLAKKLMLSALAYGLVSCPIDFAVSALNLPSGKELIGWPAENTLPSIHKPPTILTWI